MVQILPKEQGWGDTIGQFGSNLIEGYTNRADENALRKSIEELGENATPRQVLNAITGTKTYSPEAKQNMLKNYLGVSQFEELQRKSKEQETIARTKNQIANSKLKQEENNKSLERQQIGTIVNQLDIPPEHKEALAGSLTMKGAESLLKEQLKPNKEEKLTPFEKKVQERNAEEYINLSKEIPKIESTLGDIAYARQLSNDIGVGGMLTGALGLSGKAKELEGVSFTLMEPIVKIFNPSGPIAQQKLKMIQDKYVIKATDAPWTRKAKLDALERFAKQAHGRAQNKMDLIKQYNGNPPDKVIEEFDKESDTLSDAMIDFDMQAEEVKDEGMPEAKAFKGKTVTSPDGKKFYSDGIRWLKR